MLTDVTAVDMLRLRTTRGSMSSSCSIRLKNRVRLRIKAGVNDGEAGSLAGAALAGRELAGARSVTTCSASSSKVIPI